MGIRKELHLKRNGDRLVMPIACYTLPLSVRKKFCEWLRSIKFPDGYCSNLSRCVNVDDGKLDGMKSHDYHVFLQRVLSVAAYGLGPDTRATRYTGIIVNGVRFHSTERGTSRRTQNNGVLVKGVHNSKETDFYGQLTDIIELDYCNGNRFFIFKCDWWNVGDKKNGLRTNGDLISVNVSRKWYTDVEENVSDLASNHEPYQQFEPDSNDVRQINIETNESLNQETEVDEIDSSLLSSKSGSMSNEGAIHASLSDEEEDHDYYDDDTITNYFDDGVGVCEQEEEEL
ncbi:hypothetical protein V6N13_113936 [Hibiscus sabdariffa]